MKDDSTPKNQSLSSNDISAACCCVEFYQLPITKFLLGESFHPGGLKLTHKMAKQLFLDRDSCVLDIASGQGTTSLFLAEHYGCHVTALDLSLQNLSHTDKIANQKGLQNLVKTVRASADQLPFVTDKFDVIICECALCTFDNPKSVLTETYRVLKPDGRVGISDIYLNQILSKQLNTLFGHVLCISGALSITQYATLLEEAGFTQLETKREDWAINEMLETIQKNVHLLSLVESTDKIEIPNWLANEGALLNEIKQLVNNGGLGYLTLIARV